LHTESTFLAIGISRHLTGCAVSGDETEELLLDEVEEISRDIWHCK